MINFFNDIASDEDYLGYYPYIEAFNYILSNSNELITPPLVFGIHGKWGMGKTTFMNLIKKRIEKEKSFYILEINPWEYGQSQNFITIFLAKLYEKVKNKVRVQGENSGKDFVKSIFKPLKVSLDVKPIKVDYDFTKFSFDKQKEAIDKLISENFALKESISYILSHKFIQKKKIIVFIDDLDRCSVDKVMEVIESIKLIFNSNNCIFFLGCDVNYLQSALEDKYKDFIKGIGDNKELALNNFSREYLEKIIQIPFYIPSIDNESIKRYIDSILQNKKNRNIKNTKELFENINQEKKLLENFKKDLKDDFIAELIIISQINPRRIKRIINLAFLNYIFMKFKNVENNNLEINIKLLAFLCVVREINPKFYRENLSSELICRMTFEKFFSLYDKEKDDGTKEDNDDNKKNLVNDDIYKLFELYFENRKINNLNKLKEEIKYLTLYISVSNLNVLEENESEWGELSKIKSAITGKKLSVFLNTISHNNAAKSFIYWFFNEVYIAREDDFVLGIVKNVNVYSLNGEERDWLFRFSFNKNEDILEILFKWRNEYENTKAKLDEIIKYKGYDKRNKKINISDDLLLEELECIKDDLLNIINESLK